MRSVTLFANAKINLALDVLGKRSDGYHELRMIMQSVSIHDVIRLEKAESGITFQCGGGAPTDESNLAVKAARLLLSESGTKSGVKITLEKHIPSMAGMAGGSADCAAALIGTDMLFGLDTPREKLLKMACSLGADVPFCVVGGVKICEGIGEKMTALPKMPECAIVVVKPSVSVSTPWAFARFDSISSPKKGDFDGMVSAFEREDLGGIGSRLFNALEYAAGLSEIKQAKEDLMKFGACGALMTGSGSAVFGIFEDGETAEKCAKSLKELYQFCEVCKCCDSGCEVKKYE